MTTRWLPWNNGSSRRPWFLVRQVGDRVEYHQSANGRLIRYASITTATKAADKLNAGP